MFIQIIQGHVSDPDRFQEHVERWSTDLKPDAAGYLGSTWGLAEDGTAVLAARFDTAASARANSEREEQGAWWADMEPAFDDVAFLDCDPVDTMMGGGTDDAGFVQVIHGRVKDPDAARAMLRDAEHRLADARPDILGGVMAWHGDEGDFTQLMYFRSEEQARAAERGPTDPAEEEMDSQYRDMMATEPTFVDLREPHFD